MLNGSEPEPQPVKTSAARSTSKLNLCNRIPAGGEAGQKQAGIRNGLGDRARDGHLKAVIQEGTDLRPVWKEMAMEKGVGIGAGSPPPGPFACFPSLLLPCSAQFATQIAACLLLACPLEGKGREIIRGHLFQ